MVGPSKHYIIVGASRLSARIADLLSGTDVRLTLVRPTGESEQSSMPPAVKVVDTPPDREPAILAALEPETASCLLAVSDNDLTNLRWAALARKAAPSLAVVIRVFDQSLADQLEQGLNIRRAFSVSALAAPAFIAAACKAEVLETIRIGDAEAPVCRLSISKGSVLENMTAAQVKERYGCATIALRDDDGVLRGLRGDGSNERYVAGSQAIIGGPLPNVLTLLCLTAGWFDRPESRRRSAKTSHDTKPQLHVGRGRTPALIAAIILLMLLATVVFKSSIALSWIDAIYFTVTTVTTTGYGDITLKDASTAVKLFDILLMIVGAGLFGILFSNLAAKFTAERLDDIMGRRADRTSGHVVVAGLGNLGYRIANELTSIGIKVVCIEINERGRFLEVVRRLAPVLTGDCRLAQTLSRGGLARSRALIACTNDDLVNVQACLHAKRFSQGIATVARIYSDTLAEALAEPFAIDAALSASREAAPAFVGAALDERAIRTVSVGTETYGACRYRLAGDMDAESAAQMRAIGVRLLGFRRADGRLQPPSDFSQNVRLSAGDEVVLCGPQSEIEAITQLRT